MTENDILFGLECINPTLASYLKYDKYFQKYEIKVGQIHSSQNTIPFKSNHLITS